MLEREIENKVVAWAKQHGFLSLKLNVRGQVGWPDRMFLKNGRVCFIEFKSARGDLRPMQIMRIRELAMKANHFTSIVSNVAAGIIALQVFDEQTRGKR